MLNYEDLDTCDTSVFRKDAAKWQGLAGALANHGNDLQSAVTGLDSWIGDAADAAKAEFGAHRQQFAGMAETVGKIPPVLTNLTGRIDQLREQLEKIVAAAQSVGCQVHPDGTVTYDPTIGQHAPIAPGQQDMGQDVAIVCQGDIADVLNQARPPTHKPKRRCAAGTTTDELRRMRGPHRPGPSRFGDGWLHLPGPQP